MKRRQREFDEYQRKRTTLTYCLKNSEHTVTSGAPLYDISETTPLPRTPAGPPGWWMPDDRHRRVRNFTLVNHYPPHSLILFILKGFCANNMCGLVCFSAVVSANFKGTKYTKFGGHDENFSLKNWSFSDKLICVVKRPRQILSQIPSTKINFLITIAERSSDCNF